MSEDVFGAVVQEPPQDNLAKVGQATYANDEFGLLKQILYKEPSSSVQEQGPRSSVVEGNATSNTTQYIAVKIDHVLIIVGFCIGFGMVTCVAVLYYRVKPLQRFKVLNNHTGKCSLKLSIEPAKLTDIWQNELFEV